MPRIIWGPGWLESLSLLLGALILSDHGNTIWTAQYSIFLQMVFIITFASMLFSWFVCSLLLSDFFYVNKHIFSGSTINYKLTEQDQVIIRRLSARPGLTMSRQYYIWLNRCLSQPGTVYHQPAQYERSYHYSRLGLSLLLQKIGKPMMWFNITGMIYFIDYS